MYFLLCSKESILITYVKFNNKSSQCYLLRNISTSRVFQRGVNRSQMDKAKKIDPCCWKIIYEHIILESSYKILHFMLIIPIRHITRVKLKTQELASSEDGNARFFYSFIIIFIDDIRRRMYFIRNKHQLEASTWDNCFWSFLLDLPQASARLYLWSLKWFSRCGMSYKNITSQCEKKNLRDKNSKSSSQCWSYAH